MCALYIRGCLLQFLFKAMQMKRFGFTLNEILIAVVIISTLATLAMVTYVRVYEKGRGYSASAVLRLIRAAERIYYLDQNTYTDLTFPCTSPLIADGYLQCPNLGAVDDRAFNYTVTSFPGPPPGYDAVAERQAGRYDLDTITLNVTCCPETPTWAGTWPAELRP